MKTRVLIIGGGATGTGIARDLALRGVESILIEKGDINAGASGGNHGLLHSGGRYVGTDPAVARECREEGARLKRLAPHVIEETGGMFVAVSGDDERYIEQFPNLCSRCGIPAIGIDPAQALEMEPSLAKEVIAAYLVEDAAIDPFKLSLDNISQARQLGAQLMRFCRVADFRREGNRIVSTRVINTESGRETNIEADVVVNATGAWAGMVARLAGVDIPMLYSKGSLLVTHSRIAGSVINRLRPASDGDILVPGGTVSILGTTSERVQDPNIIYPTITEIDYIIDEGAAMIPILGTGTRFIRAYCGVRPLLGSQNEGDDRAVSRGFALMDHEKQGVSNFFTITGGKLTTFRLMAEKTADRVCERLGVTTPGRTDSEPLPSSVDAQWTEPGRAPRYWFNKKDPEDIILCECEMVPKSVVDDITESIEAQKGTPGLTAMGLRSRIGKGPCQGTFCSPRVTAHLYDTGHLKEAEGIWELQTFLNERWRGQRPLLWNQHQAQYELQEAVHCGIFGLELEPPPGSPRPLKNEIEPPGNEKG